jgi:hypothetical protein
MLEPTGSVHDESSRGKKQCQRYVGYRSGRVRESRLGTVAHWIVALALIGILLRWKMS